MDAHDLIDLVFDDIKSKDIPLCEAREGMHGMIQILDKKHREVMMRLRNSIQETAEVDVEEVEGRATLVDLEEQWENREVVISDIKDNLNRIIEEIDAESI